MVGYQKRVKRDLERWRGRGWVTAEGEAAILEDLAAPPRMLGLVGALATLGAVLLGFAAMSFIAANWSELPKLVRLAMVFGALLGTYAVTAALFERGLAVFAHAGLLLGSALFGGGIMLIAQMYHMDGHPPDAVLLWSIGAFVGGVLLRANSSLVLALTLVCLWSIMESSLMRGVNWWFLPAWGLVTAAFLWTRWSPGLHLSGLALSGFFVSLGYRLGNGDEHAVVVLLGIAVMAASYLAANTRWVAASFAPIGIGYGLAIAFAGLFAQQFIENPKLVDLVVLAALTLAMLVGAIMWGSRTRHPGLVWLGYTAFSIEILALYFKTLGTLLGNSLFFLLAGVLVIVLAIFAYRLNAGQPAVTGAEP